MRTKLLLATLLPMTVGLVVASLVMGTYLQSELRRDAGRALESLAGILGDNASAMLAFDDEQGATDVLGALSTRPEVTSAAIYSVSGETFATYRRDAGVTAPRRASALDGTSFVDGGLLVVHPITTPDGVEVIGRIVVESDLMDVRALSRRIALVSAVVATAAFLAALLLGLHLHRSILRPVSRLAEAARTVSEEQDYSVRAEVDSTEELGRLGRAFNEMLDRIEQNESVLRARERYFRSLIEHSNDVIIVTDSDGVITYVSPSVARVLGRSPEAYVGKHVAGQVDPMDRQTVEDRIASVQEDEPAPILLGVPHADGSERTLEAIGLRYTEEDGSVAWIINARDVTERLRMEGERERLQSQLVQAQKMEAVGQLTGGVAHDFNNLLTVMLGNMELLKMDPELGDERAELVDQAFEAAQRGSALTQRLLAFSRRQTLRPEAVEVQMLAKGMRELLVRTLGETIRVEMDVPGDMWRCEVDTAQLENAVLNLAINARDAMGSGGTLRIACENVCLTGFDDLGEDLAPGEYVAIHVSDTGSGMAEDVLDKVFEPFFTTKDVGKGTGLGLSMVYGFVRQSGGQVSIQSRLGEGTTVTLYLPRSAEGAGPALSDEEDDAHPNGDGETILVVEDDPDVRTLTLRQLDALGYRTCAASDGAEALEVLERTRGIALMLTDMVLPGGMSGAELSSEVRARNPSIPVVYMSGYARDQAEGHATLDRNASLVQKPFTRRELAAALRGALARMD